MKFNSPIFLVTALFAGCVMHYPMGLTRQQWEALPPAQQAEYQAKQYEIDTARRQAEEARRVEREKIAAEKARIAEANARAEWERIRQLYANARYGDVVQVNVQGGFIEYNRNRYPYEPVSFDLVKGETKEVAFRGRGLQTIATYYDVRLTEDGNSIFFDESSRERIVLVNQDWERGQTYHPQGSRNDVGVSIAGMTFFVKYKSLPGGPQRVIIEQR